MGVEGTGNIFAADARPIDPADLRLDDASATRPPGVFTPSEFVGRSSVATESISGADSVSFELSTELKGLYTSLSEGGKKMFAQASESTKAFFGSVFEGVVRTTGVDRLFTRIQASNNGRWAEQESRKAEAKQSKLDGTNAEIDAAKTEQARLQADIAKMKQDHTPATRGLERALSIEGSKLEKLEAKRNSQEAALGNIQEAQSRFENRRNEIIDRHEAKYDALAEPARERLRDAKEAQKSAQEKIDRMNSQHEMLRAQHQKHLENRAHLEEMVEQSGFLEFGKKRAFRQDMKEIDRTVQEGEGRMNALSAKLTAELDAANSALQKHQDRLAKKEAKRDQFRTPQFGVVGEATSISSEAAASVASEVSPDAAGFAEQPGQNLGSVLRSLMERGSMVQKPITEFMDSWETYVNDNPVAFEYFPMLTQPGFKQAVESTGVNLNQSVSAGDFTAMVRTYVEQSGQGNISAVDGIVDRFIAEKFSN